jgi:hypothetical protein
MFTPRQHLRILLIFAELAPARASCPSGNASDHRIAEHLDGEYQQGAGSARTGIP